MKTKPYHIKHTSLEDALSGENLMQAETKVWNYYRRQNLPLVPDMAIVEHQHVHLHETLREVVLDGGYTFQPLDYYVSRKKNGAPRLETRSSAIDRLLVQALLNQPGWYIQQHLDRTACIGRRLVATAYRFQRPERAFMYNRWQTAYGRFKKHLDIFAARQPHGVVLNLDIQSFFPSVSRDRLRHLLEPWFCPSVWPWLDRYLDFRVRRGDTIEPLGNGLPIEEPASRLFANLYLHELDVFLRHQIGRLFVRYMDDVYIVFSSNAYARQALNQIEDHLALQCGLYLNREKTTILTTKQYREQSDTWLSRRLSLLDQQIQQDHHQPTELIKIDAQLTGMIKAIPGPNAKEHSSVVQALYKQGNFASYRLGKLQRHRRIGHLALLLRTPQTRKMAALGLCHMDHPNARAHLLAYVQTRFRDLDPFEKAQWASYFCQYELGTLLGQLLAEPTITPELYAIVLQGLSNPHHIKAGLWHESPLVRRAAVRRLTSMHVYLPTDFEIELREAFAEEQDRDTRALLILNLEPYQDVAEVQESDPFLRALGIKQARRKMYLRGLSAHHAGNKEKEKEPQNKETITCHP